MKNGKNKHGRRHKRSTMRAKLKMKHNELGELVVFTGNLSDSGVFVNLIANDKPVVGDIVSIQLQDLPVEAPVIPARVVRLDSEGFGLEFVEQAEKT